MGLLNNSIQNSTLDCPIYTKDSEFWMEFINFWVGGVVQTLFIIFGFLGKFVTEHTLFENYFKLAVDGAFGSYSEASGGRLASLALTTPFRAKNLER